MPARTIGVAAALLLWAIGLAWPGAPVASGVAPGPALVPAPANPCASQPGAFKLRTDHAGIYEVTVEALRAAGWSGAPDPARLRIYRGACTPAAEIALDRGPAGVRFYAEPPTSRYSATNVYWLREEAGAGLTMAARDVTPAGAPLQTTAVFTAEGATATPLYDSIRPGDDGDHFFQGDIRANHTMTITFTLPVPSTGVALLLRLHSMTSSAHRLHIMLDGSDLGGQTWSGAASFTAEIALGGASLAAGAHTLVLGVDPEAIDALLLDSAALRYQAPLTATGQLTFDGTAGARRYQAGGLDGAALLYDVRDPRRPVRLEGAAAGASLAWQDAPAAPARYVVLAPGLVLQPALAADTPSRLDQGGADYLIVGYGPFLGAVEPLAAYYRGRGLRVTLVDVQDVYDEFSGGELDPEAIRGFLRHAYTRWERPAPTYVLLVGDGTYDFRDRLGLGWAGFVPPYLADVDPWLRETACDTCYVRTQTEDPRAQPLPDMLIGRLPVRSAGQAGTVVAKTLAYLTAAPGGPWQARALFLADNYRDEQGRPDSAGDFATQSESTIAALPPGIDARRFYYDPAPGAPDVPWRYGDPATLRAGFFRAFDDGAALVVYTGHANYRQWAYTAPNAIPPYLWYLYDADARTNQARLPILLSMTCLTGYFQEPQLPTTDEQLLLRPGGGIVASLSPAGQSVAYGHELLSRAVIRALYQGDPAASTLGAALLAGFRSLQAGGCCTDQLFTYAILGDPALRLRFVPTEASFLPIVRH